VASSADALYAKRSGVDEVPVIGLRRQIAERMQMAKRQIPHFTYVEEIDVTELENLRAHLNATRTADQPKLTLLPFFMRALVRVLPEFPQINATYDDEAGVVRRSAAVHIGMAAQTSKGLLVAVIKHAEARDLWDCAAEVSRLAKIAKDGKATREELTGSTITLSSLGALGGLMATPVINRPEVAIIGPNKIVRRPIVRDDDQIVIRKMMNLSSSFDHRVVDGADAAEFIQRLRAVLEQPATIFVR
jgi:2-oxoisovalerate dehydrogenase E2 component (dihydrolipoyl transacylase)